MLGAGGAPAASLAYLRGLREFQYHESLFESLGKQYEAAKLDEAKDAPLVQVVDPAIPPEETKPKRRLWIVLFGACSFGILGAVMALCWHAFRDPENAPKIHEIRGALRPGRAGAH
jgi:tyrosine-protein kinase Etk/Wzc